MALKRSGTAFVFGPEGNGAGDATGIISKSTQRRYGSENEVVGGDGEIFDIVYSGEEEQITTTKYQTSTNLDKSGIGVAGTGGGIVMRRKIDLSNEDMVKLEEESLKFQGL